MTQTTFDEKDSFFDLFSDIVDDVSISQYSERGGELTDINEDTMDHYEHGRLALGLPVGTPYMRDSQGTLFLSKQRKPCEQPFQRLMVTYEGRVGMCCYDWGATHPVGFLSPEAYQNDSEYEKVVEHAKKGHKGFELLSNIEKSKKVNTKAHLENDPYLQIPKMKNLKRINPKKVYWIPYFQKNNQKKLENE